MKKIPGLRWWIVGLLFCASILNYVDRQALSLLAPTIQADLGFDDRAYASLVNCFLVAYTVSLLYSGRLVERFGVRASLAVFVGWWSVANIFTGFARSFGTLGLSRFLLGLGEAGNWTAAPKAVAQWFPARERGLAIGIYTLGATVGATLAPFLIIGLANDLGWRGAFIATGLMGLVWVLPWLWLYRAPAQHPRLTAAERALVPAAAVPAAAVPPETEGARWRAIISRPEIWRLMGARLLTDPVWYFYQFWFAKYLHAERGLDQKSLVVTWVIFLAADLGTLGGGWFSGLLMKRRGLTPPASRLRIMLFAACLTPLSLFVPLAPALGLTLALGMAVVFAHLSWLINLSALVVDVVPERRLPTTFGFIAAGSSVGGLLMNAAVGHFVADYSYTPVFLVMAGLHPLALLLLWRLRRTAPTA